MLAGPPLLADRPHAELQSRLDGVQEARFTHSGGAGEHRFAAAQQVAQRRQALPRFRRGEQHLVTRGRVALRQRRAGRAVQLDFVDHHHRRQLIRLGDHKQPVELTRHRFRVTDRGDDHHLVDVRRDRLGAASARSADPGATHQRRAALVHPGDRRRALPVGREGEVHHVADHHAVFIRVLELAAQRGRELAPVDVHAERAARARDHHAGRHPGARSPLASISRSKWSFTSRNVRDSSGRNAASAVAPNAR